jgi:hypothetical protein
MFDAKCDFAAVVYGVKDNPDRLPLDFTEDLRQAADADIPVLIAVPEHRFSGWIRYSAGMSFRLPCRRAALDRWWQSIAMGLSARSTATTLCALAK